MSAPNYLAIAPILREPEDLARHVCIRMRADERGSNWRLTMQSEAGATPQTRTVAVEGRFVVSSVSLIRQLTLRGAGIGVIDESMAADDVTHGRLHRVLP